DPILKPFDIRHTPPGGRSSNSSDEDDGKDKADKKAARRNMQREPARRAVDIPGYGRTLRMYPSGGGMYLGETLPAWQTAASEPDKAGRRAYDIVTFDHGTGRVTLIDGLWRFHVAGWLDREDHAEILL